MSDYLAPTGLILLGFGMLTAGGEFLVRGASRLAAAVGVAPLVIGLTVVALGTSAPEMAVTLQSSLQGQADLAVGNVVGSNICNVLLILGASALVAPLAVSVRLIWRDVPLVIVASVAFLVFALDGIVGRSEGALLFGSLVVYIVWAVVQGRREGHEIPHEHENECGKENRLRKTGLQIMLVVVGLVLLTVGSHWLVLGSVAIARLLGVGELLIGLTILAIGTSLPELAASVVASLRGERDIAVGNVIGSNLFNILGVLGLSALVAPQGIAVSNRAIRFDIPVMIAVAVACLPIFCVGRRISRWGGAFLLACYLFYMTDLILRATGESPPYAFELVTGGFAILFTMICMAVAAFRRTRNRPPPGCDGMAMPCQTIDDRQKPLPQSVE